MEELVYTREEILEKIEAIYQKFPQLRNRARTSDCRCCEEYDVYDEYGPEAAGAWREIDTWKWLLGDEE